MNNLFLLFCLVFVVSCDVISYKKDLVEEQRVIVRDILSKEVKDQSVSTYQFSAAAFKGNGYKQDYSSVIVNRKRKKNQDTSDVFDGDKDSSVVVKYSNGTVGDIVTPSLSVTVTNYFLNRADSYDIETKWFSLYLTEAVIDDDCNVKKVFFDSVNSGPNCKNCLSFSLQKGEVNRICTTDPGIFNLCHLTDGKFNDAVFAAMDKIANKFCLKE